MSGARILVVDDDPGILRSVGGALRAHGYAVQSLSLAAGVPEAVRDDHPELVLLDLMLPDGDGIQVCREIRAASDVPIIVLSALGADAVKVQALDEGADDYLEKPFSMAELLARVRVSLRRRAGSAREMILVAGPLRLDLGTHTLHVGGQAVHLTATEFAVLRLLMEGQGRLLTQRMLLARVWGAEYVDDTHLLRTFIYQLRMKLGQADPAAAAMIVTDPRVGYRLAAPEG